MRTTPYAALILDEESRERLINTFPPKFSDVRADHITIAHNTEDETVLFTPKLIKVVGYATDHHGIEAALLDIDGQRFKPDGLPWHATISFDRGKQVLSDLLDGKDAKPQNYKGYFSNQLLRLALNREYKEIEFIPIEKNLLLTATPKIISKYEPKAHIKATKQPTKNLD